MYTRYCLCIKILFYYLLYLSVTRANFFQVSSELTDRKLILNLSKHFCIKKKVMFQFQDTLYINE